jgi:hypothetical protein
MILMAFGPDDHESSKAVGAWPWRRSGANRPAGAGRFDDDALAQASDRGCAMMRAEVSPAAGGSTISRIGRLG